MNENVAVWECPNCHRTFRGHVFGEATSMSGPICNNCCVPLIPPARVVEESLVGGPEEGEIRTASRWD
ncbi:MAG: hypothetical protein AABZ64_02945 [Nitrospinota bacterium]